MKKVLMSVLLLMILVGCATEESPEYYFDTALTEIENAKSLKSSVSIKIEGEIPTYDLSYEKEGVKANSSLAPFTKDIGDTDQFQSHLVQIASFNYGSVFTDFSMEDNVVVCTIPVDGSEHIVQTANQLTKEDISSITHYMYFEDETLDYVEIVVQTQTKTLTYTISLLNLEVGEK